MELQDKIGREDIVNKICSLVDNLKPDAPGFEWRMGQWKNVCHANAGTKVL